jgi:hypothetical protein
MKSLRAKDDVEDFGLDTSTARVPHRGNQSELLVDAIDPASGIGSEQMKQQSERIVPKTRDPTVTKDSCHF